MKTYNSMPRKVCNTSAFERVELNAYDVETKTIICTGTANEIGIHLKTTARRVQDAHRNKYRLFGKYAIRTKSIKPDES